MTYEPSSIDGLKEAPKSGKDYTPYVEGQVMRKKIISKQAIAIGLLKNGNVITSF